ncbi:MAG: glycosyltransferase [Thermoleophilia bacterium]
MRITVVEPRDSGGMIHYAYHLCTALSQAGARVTLLTGPDYELTDHPHNFRVLRTWRPAAPQRSARMTPARGRAGRLVRKARRLYRLGRALMRMVAEWRKHIGRIDDDRPDWVLFGSIEYFFEAPFLAQMRKRGIRLASIVHEPEARDGRRTFIRRVDQHMFRHVYAQFAALFVHNEANRRLLELHPNTLELRLVHVIEHGNNLLLPPRRCRGRGSACPSAGSPRTLRWWCSSARCCPARTSPTSSRRSRWCTPATPRRGCSSPGTPTSTSTPTTTWRRPRPWARRTAWWWPRLRPAGGGRVADGPGRGGRVPVRSATQSGALQVAYAFGRPTPSSPPASGACPRWVEEGRSGLVVPPQDLPALALAINRMLDDPEEAARMGRHAKHLSDTKHSWSHVAATILAAFSGGAVTAPSGANHPTYPPAHPGAVGGQPQGQGAGPDHSRNGQPLRASTAGEDEASTGARGWRT